MTAKISQQLLKVSNDYSTKLGRLDALDIHDGRKLEDVKGLGEKQVAQKKEIFATESRTTTGAFLTKEFPERGSKVLTARFVEQPISECRAPDEAEKTAFHNQCVDLILSTESVESVWTKVAHLLSAVAPTDENNAVFEKYRLKLKNNNFYEAQTILEFGLDTEFRNLLDRLETEYKIKDNTIIELGMLDRYLGLDDVYKIPNDLSFGFGADPDLWRGTLAAAVRVTAKWLTLLSTEKSPKEQEREKIVISRLEAFFRSSLPESTHEAIMALPQVKHSIERRRDLEAHEKAALTQGIKTIVKAEFEKRATAMIALLTRASKAEEMAETLKSSKGCKAKLEAFAAIKDKEDQVQFIKNNLANRTFANLIFVLNNWDVLQKIKTLETVKSPKKKLETITADAGAKELILAYRNTKSMDEQKAFIKANAGTPAFVKLIDDLENAKNPEAQSENASDASSDSEVDGAAAASRPNTPAPATDEKPAQEEKPEAAEAPKKKAVKAQKKAGKRTK